MKHTKDYHIKTILAFLITFIICAAIIFVFVIFMLNKGTVKGKTLADQAKEDAQKIIESENYPFIDYNTDVNEYTFTSDQLTEVTRTLFTDSGYLKDVSIELMDDNKFEISAVINDVDKLKQNFKDLEKYSVLLGMIKNKQVSISAQIVEQDDGKAGIEIENASLESISIDKMFIEPIINSNSNFTELFNVDYDMIKIEKDKLTFTGSLPEILKPQ